MASTKKTTDKKNEGQQTANDRTSPHRRAHRREKMLVTSVVVVSVLLVAFVVIIKIAVAPTESVFNFNPDASSNKTSASNKTLQEMAQDIEEGLKSLDAKYNFNGSGADSSFDAPAFEQDLQKTP